MERKELVNRMNDLALKSYRENVFCFTNFLSSGDAAAAYEVAGQNEVTLWGGSEGCERVVARFGDSAAFGYETEFPISVIKVEPLHRKFADKLSHRDYLGALMNLGIERDLIGDIVVRDMYAYVFALSHIAPFICEHLTSVRHTNVSCALTDSASEDVRPVLVREELNVSTVRIDSIIARLYHLSRGAAQGLIAGGQMLVNGRSELSISFRPKEDDVIAVRGYGKFVYRGLPHETKKGRQVVSVDRYA